MKVAKQKKNTSSTCSWSQMQEKSAHFTTIIDDKIKQKNKYYIFQKLLFAGDIIKYLDNPSENLPKY